MATIGTTSHQKEMEINVKINVFSLSQQFKISRVGNVLVTSADGFRASVGIVSISYMVNCAFGINFWG